MEKKQKKVTDRSYITQTCPKEADKRDLKNWTAWEKRPNRGTR